MPSSRGWRRCCRRGGGCRCWRSACSTRRGRRRRRPPGGRARAVPAGLGRRAPIGAAFDAGGGLHPRRRHLPGQPDHAARAGAGRASRRRCSARWPRGSRSGTARWWRCRGRRCCRARRSCSSRSTGAGGIEARPMKGTAPRDPDPARDARAARRRWRRDAKNRAENLMIVDLLRNDIGADRRGRLGAGAGAVRGGELCDGAPDGVAGHRAAAAGDAAVATIFAALFPCGSVTGAPKLRAMEIIRELEPWPREAYCGAIGWAAPDGRAAFNVAIRTLTLYPGRRGGAERRRRDGRRIRPRRRNTRRPCGKRASPRRSRRPEADRDLPLGAGRRGSCGCRRIWRGWRAAAAALGIAFDRGGGRPGAGGGRRGRRRCGCG